MPYCTPDDVIAGREADLKKRFPDGQGGIDATRLLGPIDWAERTINRYLAGRKVMPAEAQEVSDIAVDLAVYRSYTQGRPEWVTQDFNNAIATLKAMAKGEQAVADAAGNIADPASSAVVASAISPVFGDGGGIF